MEPIRDDYFIEDLFTLEVLNSPIRLRILHNLKEPRSVRDVAESLGVPVTRLYYHVNLLEEIGAIEVVETRKVGAMIQRIYRTVARNFKAAPDILDNIDDKQKFAEVGAAAIVDGARMDAEATILSQLEELDAGHPVEVLGSMGRTVVQLTDQQVREFTERLESLVKEINEANDPDGDAYGLTWVFFPQAGPFGPAE